MDSYTRRQLEDAVRYGQHDVVASVGATLYRQEDLEELKDIVRARAPRYEYSEFGGTMFYDGDIEIGRHYVTGTGEG